ncbi:MAG: hypothetical protein ACD_2C00017G0005 [uncultured bacterium (gcode 4)]|uniref:Uncharacterized protein n=1 Tax=uncultured bacterium (gcode 4) TaxID=1234023 RepID=K2G4R6_9BACT|nr:MAG: hypothetical protein ACD_2C00017G0005 [uncultured bacterium (gcode 4)]
MSIRQVILINGLIRYNAGKLISKIMKILFCAAHPNELKSIRSVSDIRDFKDIRLEFLHLWIWIPETVFSLTKYLEKNEIDFLVNIWICWKINDSTELLQIWRVVNSVGKELIVPVPFEFAPLSSIICLDAMARNPDDLKWEDYADMESFWVEFISSKYQIPRIILKLPADKIWNAFDKDLLKTKCEELWNIDYMKLISEIIKFTNNRIKPQNTDYIKENYRFTFQEFEQMKFRINKYEALTKGQFKDFFEQNNHLKKDEFIRLLENNFSFDS